MSNSINHICKRLKIKYVLHELKDKYSDKKQRIAVAISISDKFCKVPKENITKTFLEWFSHDDLKKIIGTKVLKKVDKQFGDTNKKHIIEYLMNKLF